MKRRKFLGKLALLGVLFLGVGYTLVNNTDVNVTGSAKFSYAEREVDAGIRSVTSDTLTATISEDKKTVTLSTKEAVVYEKGEDGHLFTIEFYNNDSDIGGLGVRAKSLTINGANASLYAYGDTSEWIEISTTEETYIGDGAGDTPLQFKLNLNWEVYTEEEATVEITLELELYLAAI